MTHALRLILGDQLTETLSIIHDADAAHDVFLMCEVKEEARYVKHHKKKIAFIFSAMRHFAEMLRSKGFRVEYIAYDDPQNNGSFDGEVKRHIERLRPKKLIVTEASEWRVMEKFKKWKSELSIPFEILADERFLCLHDEFAAWAQDKKQLRMEFFYREMRKRYDLLMNKDGTPVGGVWNFDKENRKSIDAPLLIPKRVAQTPTAITAQVIALVQKEFPDHFGTLEPFTLAVTRDAALREMDDFIAHFLPHFGDYQDAMLAGDPYLFHSRLSTYINAGLLLPLEVCRAAHDAFKKRAAPLNAVEGFIRQIIGWREYVRGIYWHYMPDYADKNYFGTQEPLPAMYWTANTKMNCIREAVTHTRDHAYSHHIQRLMVTGNFALLAGIDVREVQEWYLAVYSDAFEWVEMPNTLGMALYGDGGLMASKPYAASGKYIQRMSNYCTGCAYDPEQLLEKNACPFNALYWDFFARNQKKLKQNHRIPYVYSTWAKSGEAKQKAISEKAQQVLEAMRKAAL